MIHDPKLFDESEGMKRAREGAARADEHAADKWKALADLAIMQCARRLPEFTSDEVWMVLDGYGIERPPEGRAMGHRMTAAAKAGTISKTDRVQPTKQVKSHHSPKNIWRSNILTVIHDGPSL